MAIGLAAQRWTVRLSAAAETDYRQIVRWTLQNFGPTQATDYAALLTAALQALCAGPNIIGVKAREEIGANIWTLHVARQGQKGRHFILFRVSRFQKRQVIDVLRLLHDSMDLQRHLPPTDLGQ